MHAYLTEIHYVELAELNMSQRCKISVQRYIYSYLKGSDNIRVKIKDVTKELRKKYTENKCMFVQAAFFSSYN